MASQFPANASSLVELEIPDRTEPALPSGEWGINIAAAQGVNPDDGLKCQIQPWDPMEEGDKVTLLLDGIEVSHDVIDANEVNQRVTLFVKNLTTGAYTLNYSVTRLSEVIGVPETPIRIYAKLERPGGKDENGSAPGHSELYMFIDPQIIGGVVDKETAKNGVPITIRTKPGSTKKEVYPNIAVGDICRLSWGWKIVESAPVTELQIKDPANNPIVITVDEETILLVGDSDEEGLAVAFYVRDIVNNHSEDWSAPQWLEVDTGNSRLDAPVVKQAEGHVLDLDTLGGEKVIVQINAKKPSFEKDDIIVVNLKGNPLEGPAVDINVSKTIDKQPDTIVEVELPNAAVRLLAQTQVVFSYHLEKQDGSKDLKSKGRFIDIIGEANRLAAPVADDARQGALDPALANTTVSIPFDESMVAGQEIELKWVGTQHDNGNYDPVLEWYPISNNDVLNRRPIPITVSGQHIVAIKDGKLDLYYLIHSIGDDEKPTKRESIHLETLIIGAPLLELVVPEVEKEQGGTLNPEDVLTGFQLTIPYTGTQAEDVVKFTWLGSTSGSISDSITLNSFTAGKPVEFKLGSQFVTDHLLPNRRGIVEVWYEVNRPSEKIRYSNTLILNISKARPVLQIVGRRSSSGPYYYSNPTLLNGSPTRSGDVLWTYEGDSSGIAGQYFIDIEPERPLIVTLQDQGTLIEKHILRPGNITGLFNLANRHSGCITKDDGSVFGWSDNAEMLPPADLTDVSYVTAGGLAYAAIKRDGTVRAWGAAEFGGTIPSIISAQLRSVKKVAANGGGAFVALRADGSLVAWGHKEFGGVIPTAISSQLRQVKQVVGTTTDFSALLSDGRVFSWGETWPQGLNITAANGAVRLSANNRAFAALKTDRRVVAWGSKEHGGEIPAAIAKQLLNVTHISATSAAFTALKVDGSVIAWGNSRFGGVAPGTLQNVQHVTGTTTAFCALKKDGSLVAWGESGEGATIPKGLGPVLTLSASYGSFSALLEDFTVVSWGINSGAAEGHKAAGVYHAGPHWVLLTPQDTVYAWGSGAPDLQPLDGQISYAE
jgi:hypothetical protein